MGQYIRTAAGIGQEICPGAVQDMALSPEGRHLVAANADGTIGVLRLAPLGEVFRAPSGRGGP